jgi:hypothetical protein
VGVLADGPHAHHHPQLHPPRISRKNSTQRRLDIRPHLRQTNAGPLRDTTAGGSRDYVRANNKLPDVVLYDENRNWLFLIEAVTSHGPVSAKRHVELEAVLTNAGPGRVYVSAFPSFREFKRYADQIAWETEVWVAEFPEHLLHYNGDRFFGPRSSK